MQQIGKEVSASGLLETTHVSEDGALTVEYQQDSEATFEAVQGLRNSKDVFREGMKKDMVHAFHIPNGVVMELFKHGVNIYTDPMPDIIVGLKKLGRYDACRLTDKRFA
jgi:hypothetical protein